MDHSLLKKAPCGHCFSVIALILGTAISGIALPLQAEDMEPIRGVVKARHEAVLSVELNARVIETPVRTGESFRKDDVLLRFDCEVLDAEAKATVAAYSAATATHNSNREMETYGAVGKFEVSISKAEMEGALANAEAVVARAKDCTIVAPYDGKVAELGINAFETPGPNQPLMKIMSSKDYELRLIVPSNWLLWMQQGQAFNFDVDETGKRYAAKVASIGAEVDAVSRTVPIVARFSKHPKEVRPGMSGTASFKRTAGNS